MTREHLLHHLLHQARSNGFELRRWFRTDAALPWPGGDAALHWLSQGRRIHLVLFSHSFAQAFFGGKDGLRSVQPAVTYQRTAPNGVTRTVTRRAHARTTRHRGSWRYHLHHMALAPDPLRYAEKFVVSAEALRKPVTRPGPPASPPPVPDYDEELLVREA